MKKAKQIEEMTKDLQKSEHWYFNNHSVDFELDRKKTAENLYNAGYRKQSEGEWIDADPDGHLYRFTCSLCGKTKLGRGTPYCPHCGAKMKGGE